MTSRPNLYQIGNKTWCVTKVSKFYVETVSGYILTGLKVSSLACKCVFYRLKHNAKGDSMELNFESLEM